MFQQHWKKHFLRYRLTTRTSHRSNLSALGARNQEKIMFAKITFAAVVALGLGVATEAANAARARVVQPMTQGREIAAPSWSFACINDQGPTVCNEPMWAYGSVR
jgi:hypothetical protein